MTRKRKGSDRRKQRDQFERKRQHQDGLVLVEWLSIAAIVSLLVAGCIFIARINVNEHRSLSLHAKRSVEMLSMTVGNINASRRRS